jgi:hypothetical protein
LNLTIANLLCWIGVFCSSNLKFELTLIFSENTGSAAYVYA